MVRGAVCRLVTLIEIFWARTPFSPRWAVPLAWAVAVAAVACLSYAVPFVVRVVTLPRANFFGISIGAGVGWGILLIALSAAVLAGHRDSQRRQLLDQQ